MEGKTTDLTALLDRNRTFAEQFEAGDLAIRPRMSTIIMICVDSCVDSAHLFGLALGDALVIRNGGGLFTPAVLKDLTWGRDARGEGVPAIDVGKNRAGDMLATYGAGAPKNHVIEGVAMKSSHVLVITSVFVLVAAACGDDSTDVPATTAPVASDANV